MKFFLKPILGLCLITGLFFSCKKNVQNTEEQNISSSRQGDTIIHRLNINGSINIVKEFNNEFFYAHDILLSKEQFNSLKKMTLSNLSTVERSTIVQDFLSTWPNATVYYSYPDATTMTAAQYTSFVATIDAALTKITDSTNIQFVQRTTQTEYMKFVKSSSTNSSPLGWQKNRVNTVNLYNYTHVGITMHEVLHSLGVMHEQCRPDRDQYIIVDTSRVTDGAEHNFNKYTNYAGHGPFDFNSIMIYSSGDFAKNAALPPMTKLDGTTFTKQRNGLSPGDVNGLKSLYFPTVANGTYRISPVYLTSKSIDITGSSTADGTNVILYTNGTGNNQKFSFRKVDNGYYQIKSLLDTNKVLTVRSASTVSGTQVELRTNAGSTSQKFKLYNRGNDGFSFAPMHATSLRLEVLGAGTANLTSIVVSTSNTSSQAQRFNLTKL